MMDYWAGTYDWRVVETKLNALPMFKTEIDGLDIHFIHVRSRHDNAMPMILTHGWRGSILEFLQVDGASRQGGRCLPSRYPIDSGLRLFRQA